MDNQQDYDLEKDPNMEEVKYSLTYKIILTTIYLMIAFTPLLIIAFTDVLNSDTFPIVAFIVIISPLISYHYLNDLWNVRHFRERNSK